MPALSSANPASDTAEGGLSGLVDGEDPLFGWLWWLAFAVFALLVGAALYLWRQRQAVFAGPPEIAPPLARAPRQDSEGDHVPAPATSRAAPKPAFGLAVDIDASVDWLSRSFANVTLKYTLRLRNVGTSALEAIDIKGDLTSAHSRVPVGEQLATGETALDTIATLDRLDPRAKHEISGELRLPIATLRLIRQGKAALYVPLLRVRVDAEGVDPVMRTFVIGTVPAIGTGRLQPFRADEMAQTYRNIDCRPLD